MSAQHKIALVLLGSALAAVMSGCGGGGASVVENPSTLAIVTTSLPDAVNGQFYSQSLLATGGVSPYTWSLAAGSAPLAPGLTLASNGAVTGTTTFNNVATGFNFTAQVRDARGATASGLVRMNAAGVLAVSNSLPNATAGAAYSQQIVVSNGTPPFTFTLTSLLPTGLALSPSGLLSGTPTVGGNFSFSIQVKDSGSPTQVWNGVAFLLIAGGIVITTGNLPIGVQGKPYSATLSATGGTPPYLWNVAPNQQVPFGLSLSQAGVISGTPAYQGSMGFGVTVSDSSQPSLSTTHSVFIQINPPLGFATSNSLPDVPTGVPDNVLISVSGGVPPYTLQVISGSIPDGTSLPAADNFGYFRFSGTPTTANTYTFTLQVSDSESPVANVTQMFTERVNPQLQAQFPSSLPPGLVGQPYGPVQFTATGGLLPLRWSLIAPNALTIDSSTGLMAGTPSVPYKNGWIFVQVQDAANPPQNVEGILQLYIADILRLATSSLPPVVGNAAVNMQLGLAGGTGPFTWNITSGGLPTGVSMDSSGKLTGTAPPTPPSSPFTVQISDPGPPAQSATGNLVFLINPAPGRNDSIANATQLSNGTYTASISPFDDPPGAAPAPDVDVYKLTANPGAVVQVETFAERLVPSSPLDSVIEIVDSSGNRLQTCNSFGVSGPFTAQCMNDDSFVVGTLDSLLFFQVPPSASGPMTFYVRVLDWRGDARPDLVYQISISGAN